MSTHERVVMKKLDWYVDYLSEEKLDSNEKEAAKTLVDSGTLRVEVDKFNGKVYYRKNK